MRIKWFEYVPVWEKVKRAARTTISKEGPGKPVTEKWKKQALLSEHSMIRLITMSWKWTDLFSWVSVHFVRHWLGIIHFVTTQRSDRTGEDRNSKRQDALVEHECTANAQAMINISRKRLCSNASPETRQAWQAVIDEVAKKEPVLASVCVPECIYRGFCPDFNSCGYCKTEAYKKRLEEYRRID